MFVTSEENQVMRKTEKVTRSLKKAPGLGVLCCEYVLVMEEVCPGVKPMSCE